jgi:hypothetical protein
MQAPVILTGACFRTKDGKKEVQWDLLSRIKNGSDMLPF